MARASAALPPWTSAAAADKAPWCWVPPGSLWSWVLLFSCFLLMLLEWALWRTKTPLEFGKRRTQNSSPSGAFFWNEQRPSKPFWKENDRLYPKQVQVDGCGSQKVPKNPLKKMDQNLGFFYCPQPNGGTSLHHQLSLSGPCQASVLHPNMASFQALAQQASCCIGCCIGCCILGASQFSGIFDVCLFSSIKMVSLQKTTGTPTSKLLGGQGVLLSQF